jgi:hypothetical protein
MEAVAAYERALGASSASASESLHGAVQLLTDMGDNELATLWRSSEGTCAARASRRRCSCSAQVHFTNALLNFGVNCGALANPAAPVLAP